MSALELQPPAHAEPRAASEHFAALRLEAFGELVPVGRRGGQGRVYRPLRIPATLAAVPVVVKLYRCPPSVAAVRALIEMVTWSRSLDSAHGAHLHRIAAWPLGIITAAGRPVGIAMHDMSGRFEVPFAMPSGRQERVLMSLEHLLGGDDYLRLRGLGVRLNTTVRAEVAERISGALGFLHRQGVVASDIAPNNVLVAFGPSGPTVCFIDCDSMVFHGRPALAPVETADWQIPAGFSEPPRTRAADAYKLGLVVLRLFARCHDARLPTPYIRHVPTQLRGLLGRSLSGDAANRPPAGEWQLALRHLRADGGLNERYPGPAPAPILTSLARGSIQRPAAVSPARAPPPSGRTSQGSPVHGNRQHLVSLAWLAVATVVFAMILARLLSAAVPSLGGGAAPGASGGGQANGSYQYYYTPDGPGSGNAVP